MTLVISYQMDVLVPLLPREKPPRERMFFCISSVPGTEPAQGTTCRTNEVPHPQSHRAGCRARWEPRAPACLPWPLDPDLAAVQLTLLSLGY